VKHAIKWAGKQCPWVRDALKGRECLALFRAHFSGPARASLRDDALRLVILNHFYDQDMDSFLRADVDCAIWRLDPRMIWGVRDFFRPGSDDLHVAYESRAMQACVRAARRHFVSKAVAYVLARAAPDIVLTTSDVFFWFRPFVEEFQAQGVPVVVQDKEGVLAPGPLMENHLALVMRNYPPFADRYYFWGNIQRDGWVQAGLDPSRIRVLGQPRSDFFFHPARFGSKAQLGLPEGKKLVTCFSFDADAYLAYGERSSDLGKPWKRMRDEMHAALKRLAAERSDTYVVVKCHPQSQELDAIREELRDATNLTILYGAATAAQLIVHSDVIVGFQTTALIESMLTAKPIVYCGWAEKHAAYAHLLLPIAESGACYLPDSPAALYELLTSLLEHPEVPASMLAGRREFVSRYIADADGYTANRILGDIRSTFLRRRSTRS
jgi:surface carbohydrate biosynthesis protein